MEGGLAKLLEGFIDHLKSKGYLVCEMDTYTEYEDQFDEIGTERVYGYSELTNEEIENEAEQYLKSKILDLGLSAQNERTQ